MDVLLGVLEAAAAAPSAPAVKDPTRDLDFAGLAREVSELAAGLSARGITSQDRVVLDVPNSTDFFVASLACLWIGAMFVPLSPADPEDRRTSIVGDSEPALIVIPEPAAGESDNPAPEVTGYSGHLALPISDLRVEGATPPEPRSEGDLAAYCIYTSGTSGTPKGAVIPRRAFAAAVEAAVAAFGFGAHTRSICVSPFHFDGSYATLYPTPFAGGSLVIPRRESLLLPRMFFRAVEREQANHTSCSPSYLRLLLTSPDARRFASSPLRTMGVGGEALAASDLERAWVVAPQLRIFNRYGPTEATISVSTLEMTPEVVHRGPLVPIGQPHPGVVFRLLDPDGQLLHATGEVGELYIGGTHLMSGYWHDPALTATVLRDDFVPGELLYRTGDLMYRDEAGDYVYVDRADRVVKRDGVRISLVEISSALERLDSITAAVCTPFDNEGGTGIAAFVLGEDGVEAPELRRAVREFLPSTMIPNVVVHVATWPLTGAGKIDERALLEQAGLRPLGKPGGPAAG